MLAMIWGLSQFTCGDAPPLLASLSGSSDSPLEQGSSVSRIQRWGSVCRNALSHINCLQKSSSVFFTAYLSPSGPFLAVQLPGCDPKLSQLPSPMLEVRTLGCAGCTGESRHHIERHTLPDKIIHNTTLLFQTYLRSLHYITGRFHN